MTEGPGFSVRWGDRSDSKFYAPDTGTYPAKVEDINWRQSNKTGADMAIVKFVFPDGVRVTKPRHGTVVERNRTLDNLFMFQLDFQLEQVFDFLVAAGAATEDELEAMGEADNEVMFKLFEATRGADLAVRITKRLADTKKNPNARVDEEGNENRFQNFYHKNSPQYERAMNAISATIDTSASSGAKKKSRS